MKFNLLVGLSHWYPLASRFRSGFKFKYSETSLCKNLLVATSFNLNGSWTIMDKRCRVLMFTSGHIKKNHRWFCLESAITYAFKFCQIFLSKVLSFFFLGGGDLLFTIYNGTILTLFVLIPSSVALIYVPIDCLSWAWIFIFSPVLCILFLFFMLP